MNNEALAAYEAAIDEERDAYRALLDAMGKHEEALMSHEPPRINEALQRNLDCLERARLASVARKGTDREVADDAAQPLREKLMELGKLGREIRRRNARNRRMVEHSLDLLRGEFQALDEMIQSAMGRSAEERAGGSLVSIRA